MTIPRTAQHATLLTGVGTTRTGATVEDIAANGKAAGSFDLIPQAAAYSGRQRLGGTHYRHSHPPAPATGRPGGGPPPSGGE